MVKHSTTRKRHYQRRSNKGGKYDKNSRRYSPVTNPTTTLEEHQEQERIRQQEQEEQRFIEIVQNMHNPDRFRQLVAQLPINVLERFMQHLDNELRRRNA